MRSLDIGIVGCGTAGPAAALFLARQGHKITIYERVTNPTAIGAGIILQPTGQAVLARLGLAEEVIQRGERLDSLKVTRHEAGTLLELAYADVDPRYFGVGLHRGVLFSALYTAVQAEPGVSLELGLACDGLARADHGRFYVVDLKGEHHGPHDLVIAADGAKSRFRDDTGLSRTADPYPWGALWFVAEDPKHVFQGRLLQTVNGTRRMLGLLPTGIGPDVGGKRGTVPLVSLYWSIDIATVDAWRTSGFEAWRGEIVAMQPDAEDVVAQICGPEDVLLSQYHDVVMRPWNTRAVVHLGDSAHAMSPQLGQGANLALFDAMILADSIEKEDGDVVRALHRYSNDRRAHLTYYETITRALTPFFQSNYDVLGVMRDLVMPLIGRLGPFRKAMILGMTGTADGSPFREIDVRAVAKRK